MYYDSPLGKTFYTSQDGKFNVELLLRRQFKIVDGKMEYMFDSDIAIEDRYCDGKSTQECCAFASKVAAYKCTFKGARTYPLSKEIIESVVL